MTTRTQRAEGHLPCCVDSNLLSHFFGVNIASSILPPHLELSSMVVWTRRAPDLCKNNAGVLEPCFGPLPSLPLLVVRWTILLVCVGWEVSQRSKDSFHSFLEEQMSMNQRSYPTIIHHLHTFFNSSRVPRRVSLANMRSLSSSWFLGNIWSHSPEMVGMKERNYFII